MGEDELFQAGGGEPRERSGPERRCLPVTGDLPAPENVLHPTKANAELIGYIPLGGHGEIPKLPSAGGADHRTIAYSLRCLPPAYPNLTLTCNAL